MRLKVGVDLVLQLVGDSLAVAAKEKEAIVVGIPLSVGPAQLVDIITAAEEVSAV